MRNVSLESGKIMRIGHYLVFVGRGSWMRDAGKKTFRTGISRRITRNSNYVTYLGLSLEVWSTSFKFLLVFDFLIVDHLEYPIFCPFYKKIFISLPFSHFFYILFLYVLLFFSFVRVYKAFLQYYFLSTNRKKIRASGWKKWRKGETKGLLCCEEKKKRRGNRQRGGGRTPAIKNEKEKKGGEWAKKK